MSTLAQAGGGVMLALSFALLWQRRLPGMLMVLALQSAIAALVAARHAVWPVAGVELAWCAVGLPWLLSRTEPGTWRGASLASLTAAAALTAACLPLGVVGPGLAVVLLGALSIAGRSRPAVLVAALGSVQAGAVIAGLAAGERTALLVAPCLPALGLALCNGLYPSRWMPQRTSRWSAARFTRELREADFIGCVLLLLAACAIPFLAGAVPGPWQFDAPGVLAAVLVSLAGSLLRWPNLMARPASSGTFLVLSAFVAILADNPILAWIGLAAATAVAIRPLQLRLAGIGLGLTLFGSLTLQAAALPAAVTLLVGLGCLAALGPELAVLAVLFLLRVRVALGAVPGLDPLLIAAGLLALLLTLLPWRIRLAELTTLGMGGVAVFALGVDAPEARFAAVLLIVSLVLSRLALELAPEDGLPRIAALAGLFPSLVLVLSATAAHRPLLLVPLAGGLAALGWRMLSVLPARSYRLRPSLAWLPVAALLLIGFGLPGPIGAGLRLVVGQLP